MKNAIYILLTLLFVFVSCAPEEEIIDTTLTIEADYALKKGLQKTFVPDDVFEQILINKGYDDILDDYVLTEKISSVELLQFYPIYPQFLTVTDLTGIEDFEALTKLNFEYNGIESFNFSKNQNLKVLRFLNCKATTLDISQNKFLEELQIEDSGFTYLNLSQNKMLKRLSIISSDVENIDLTQNKKLEYVFLDTAGTIANVYISKNHNLKSFTTRNFDLISLDVSASPKLTTLDTRLSPSLNCIQVSKKQLNNIPEGWIKHDWQTYSVDCEY